MLVNILNTTYEIVELQKLNQTEIKTTETDTHIIKKDR